MIAIVLLVVLASLPPPSLASAPSSDPTDHRTLFSVSQSPDSLSSVAGIASQDSLQRQEAGISSLLVVRNHTCDGELGTGQEVVCSYLHTHPPLCQKTWADDVAVVYGFTQALFVIGSIVCIYLSVLHYVRVTNIVKATTPPGSAVGWPLQRTVLALTVLMSATFVPRMADPLGWRVWVPIVIVMAMRGISIACCFSIIYSVVNVWIIGLMPRVASRGLYQYFMRAVHVITWSALLGSNLIQYSSSGGVQNGPISGYGSLGIAIVLSIVSLFGTLVAYRVHTLLKREEQRAKEPLVAARQSLMEQARNGHERNIRGDGTGDMDTIDENDGLDIESFDALDRGVAGATSDVDEWDGRSTSGAQSSSLELRDVDTSFYTPQELQQLKRRRDDVRKLVRLIIVTDAACVFVVILSVVYGLNLIHGRDFTIDCPPGAPDNLKALLHGEFLLNEFFAIGIVIHFFHVQKPDTGSDGSGQQRRPRTVLQQQFHDRYVVAQQQRQHLPAQRRYQPGQFI